MSNNEERKTPDNLLIGQGNCIIEIWRRSDVMLYVEAKGELI